MIISTLNIILVYFRPDNINSCPYYRRDSGEITNSNTVTFGSSIAGLKNPIKIPFDSWPVSSRNEDHGAFPFNKKYHYSLFCIPKPVTF